MLADSVLEMVSLHECQSVAVEHEPDVDEKHAVAGAAVEKFLFEQLAHAALIGAVADTTISAQPALVTEFRELLITCLQARAGEVLDEKTTLVNLASYLNIEPGLLFGGGSLKEETAAAIAEQLATLLDLEEIAFDEFATLAMSALAGTHAASEPNPFARAVRFLRHASGLTQTELTTRDYRSGAFCSAAERGYVLNEKAISRFAKAVNLSAAEQQVLHALADGARLDDAKQQNIQRVVSHFAKDGLTMDTYLKAAAEQPQLFRQRPETIISNIAGVVNHFAADGLSTHDYLAAALRQPSLFARRPDSIIGHVQDVVRYFAEEGLTARDYLAATCRSPAPFSMHPNRIIGNVEAVARHFQSRGLTARRYLNAALSHPALLAQSPQTVIHNVERVLNHFASAKLSAHDYLEAACQRPSLFSQRPETLIENIECVVRHFAQDGLTTADYVKLACKRPSQFYQSPQTIIRNIEGVVRRFATDGLTNRNYLQAARMSPGLFTQRPETIAGHLQLLTRCCQHPHVRASLPDPPPGMSHAIAYALSTPHVLGLADENLMLRDLYLRVTGDTPFAARVLKASRAHLETRFAKALGHSDISRSISKVADEPDQPIGPHARNVLLRAMIRTGLLRRGTCRDD